MYAADAVALANNCDTGSSGPPQRPVHGVGTLRARHGVRWKMRTTGSRATP